MNPADRAWGLRDPGKKKKRRNVTKNVTTGSTPSEQTRGIGKGGPPKRHDLAAKGNQSPENCSFKFRPKRQWSTVSRRSGVNQKKKKGIILTGNDAGERASNRIRGELPSGDWDRGQKTANSTGRGRDQKLSKREKKGP